MNELIRYGAVGVVNTCVGYAIFWVGLRLFGLPPNVANAITYAISLCLSFVLSRYFVFTAAAPARHAAFRFALAFCIAFSLNQMVLFGLTHSGWLIPEIAQLFAMVSYTVAFYLLSKFFVFRDATAAPCRQDP